MLFIISWSGEVCGDISMVVVSFFDSLLSEEKKMGIENTFLTLTPRITSLCDIFLKLLLDSSKDGTQKQTHNASQNQKGF